MSQVYYYIGMSVVWLSVAFSAFMALYFASSFVWTNFPKQRMIFIAWFFYSKPHKLVSKSQRIVFLKHYLAQVEAEQEPEVG